MPEITRRNLIRGAAAVGGAAVSVMAAAEADRCLPDCYLSG